MGEDLTDADLTQEVQQIPGIKRLEVLNEKASEITVRVYPNVAAAPPVDKIVRHFVEKGRLVTSVFVEQGRLDEVFRTITTSHAGDTEK